MVMPSDPASDHDCLEIREHFFRVDGRPRMAITLLYSAEGQTVRPRFEGDRQSYKKHLAEKDYALFHTLKEWRNTLAKSRGIPPYIIFDNTQLANIAAQRPGSKASLQRIDGIGAKKADEYWPFLEKLFDGGGPGDASA